MDNNTILAIVLLIILIILICVRISFKDLDLEKKSIITDRDLPLNNNLIPNIIIQSLSNNIVTKGIYNSTMTWKNMNPTYSYRFFTDEKCIDFITKHFDNNVLICFNKLNFGAFKADLFRYCYLYINGGIWCDVTSECMVPCDNYIKSNTDLFVTRDIFDDCLFNAFMGFKPNHPILKIAIDLCVDNIINDNDKGKFKLYYTGPGVLGKAYMLYYNMNKIVQPVNDNVLFFKNEFKFTSINMLKWFVLYNGYSIRGVYYNNVMIYKNKFTVNSKEHTSAVSNKKHYSLNLEVIPIYLVYTMLIIFIIWLFIKNINQDNDNWNYSCD